MYHCSSTEYSECDHFHWSNHIFLHYTSLSPLFHSFLQVPDKLAISTYFLGIYIYSHLKSHLLPYKVNGQVHCLKSHISGVIFPLRLL